MFLKILNEFSTENKLIKIIFRWSSALGAYTISETAKRLGYKSTKTIYRLLKRDLLEDYIYLERSGRVYLVLERQNLPSLGEKIRTNIQFRRKNIIKRFN